MMASSPLSPWQIQVDVAPGRIMLCPILLNDDEHSHLPQAPVASRKERLIAVVDAIITC